MYQNVLKKYILMEEKAVSSIFHRSISPETVK
jgi:hypothetical protein